jgi:DNA-binding transcriptional MerR regulator
MRTSDVALRTGAPVAAIRCYERAGLLPPPGRTTPNCRVYAELRADQA